VAIFRPSWFTHWVFGWPLGLPIHTIRFLDDATSRDLLHKDGRGGGYRFAHSYVFDYFVGQERP